MEEKGLYGIEAEDKQVVAAAGRAARMAGTGLLMGMAVNPDEPEYRNPKSYLEAPYAYRVADNENVILNNGALTYTVTDFVLPGRNGFDFAVTRKYDSSLAYMEEMTPQAYVGGIQTRAQLGSHVLRCWHLGYGWQYALPSIEVVPEAERVGGVSYSTFLHLADGRSFVVENGALKDHPLQDVVYAEGTGTVVHPCGGGLMKTYDAMVRYKNGCRDYFARVTDGSGRLAGYALVARQDRFDNAIFYSVATDGSMTVVDSWGRTIRLQKDGGQLVWILPGDSAEKPVRIHYHFRSTGQPVLSGVTDQMGRTTQYSYHNEHVYAAVCKVASGHYGDHTAIAFRHMLLAGISHPTGAQTCYEYGISAGGAQPLQLTVNDYGGYRQVFPVRHRQDVANGLASRAISYGYELSNSQRYIQHSTETRANEVADRHSFNEKGQLESRQTRHAGALVGESRFIYGTDAAAADYKLVKSECAKQHDPQNAAMYREKNTEYHYTPDKKGDLARLAESWPTAPQLNQETLTQYGAYSLVTERRVKKDDSTEVVERYTPMAALGGRVMEWRRVYESRGGAENLREKTRYEYGTGMDAQYCVVREEHYYATERQALESSGLRHAALYGYDAGQYTHAPVRTTLTGMVDAAGQPCEDITEQCRYDVWGRVVRATDPLGHTTDTEYDVLGRVVRQMAPVVEGARAEKRVIYNDAANTVTEVDENGHCRRTEYTPLGLPARVYLAEWETPGPGDVLLQAMEYDEQERLVREMSYDGLGAGTGNIRATTLYGYDRMDRVVEKTVPQAGYREVCAYTDVFAPENAPQSRRSCQQKTVYGGCAAVADVVTASVMDAAGRVLEEYLGGVCVAAYEYDKLGNKTRATDARGLVTRYGYDHAGRQCETLRGAEAWPQRCTTRYDALGNKVESSDWAGNSTRYVYDAAGRLLRQEAPFDEARRAVTEYAYDAAGNLTEQRVEAGGHWRCTGYRYDARGRQTEVIQYENDAKTQYCKTAYVYDGVGNKLEMRCGMTHASGAYTAVKYTYTRHGSVESVTDALGQQEHYSYDPTGRLVQKTDRNGSVTVCAHDCMGRLLREEVTAKAGGHTLRDRREYGYGPTGAKLREAAHSEVDGVAGAALVSEYTYDSCGRLKTQADPGGARKEFRYDAAGSRERFALVLPGGSAPEIELWYNYDELGRLACVRRGGAGGPVLAEYGYDTNGNRTHYRAPAAGVATLTRHNAAGLVTRLENRRPGGKAEVTEYTYSPDGNQTAKSCDGETTRYGYDRLGRLAWEDDPAWNRLEYEYDARGNRAAMRTVPNGVRLEKPSVTRYAHDANNRLLAEVKTCGQATETRRYCYDAAGNQTRCEREETKPLGAGALRGRTGLAKGPKKPTVLDSRVYNGWGQQVSVWRDGVATQYRYRADGLRHSKTVDGAATVHHWDGQSMVLETSAPTGAVKARYLRGTGLICQIIDLSVLYYVMNAHGDTVRQVRTNGTATPKYTYDAFGNQRDVNSNDPNPFRYCGEYYDAETEEVYLRARYYNTATGRFGAEDSVKDGTNWYRYCGYSPVMKADPSGQREPDIWTGDIDRNGNKKSTPDYRKKTGSTTQSKQPSPIDMSAHAYVVTPDYSAANYQHNQNEWAGIPAQSLNWIHGQATHQQFANMKLGTMGNGADNGCGIVAMYNAGLKLGMKDINPADIIYQIEQWNGARFGGLGGIWEAPIQRYFDTAGFKTSTPFLPHVASYDDYIKSQDVVICEYFWGDNETNKIGMHYVMIFGDPVKQKFIVANEYENGTGFEEYVSVEVWIEEQKYVPMWMLGISK